MSISTLERRQSSAAPGVPRGARPARPGDSRGRRWRQQQGFTLVEVLIATSLILIMLSLVIMVMGARRRAPEVRTRVTLSALKAMADEYQVATNLDIADGASSGIGMAPPGGYPAGLTINDPVRVAAFKQANPGQPLPTVPANQASSIELFVWAGMQNPEVEMMLAALGPAIFVDRNENGLMEVVDGWGNPVAYSTSGGGPLPSHPRPFFASAGADGQWGTGDDMYSFDLELGR
jgi:prepilin-type N-terminal cleavage/methylation domain-containing protein